LDILTQLASGINYIHSLGILHRDLKTANILLKNDGTIKITDFGVCEFVKNKPPGFKCLSVGTPIYMSPEAHKKF
jgi:serine/threonine-protein kinase